MTNNTENINASATVNIMERIAHSVIVAYAWAAGPGMTDQQRTQRELERSHRELELETGGFGD